MPLLNPPILISSAGNEAHYALARVLVNEYVAALGVDLSFQGYEGELQSLERMYAAPRGVLLLAWRDSEAIGCIGVRPLSAKDCEMKRLYVRPSARGLGLGRTLAERAIAWASDSGYRRICLDTLASMAAARALYRELGFEVIEPYNDNPLAGTTFMALALNRYGSAC
ncbi:MAG TPA: GNAT family N-acetyltransferase [Steroidobacteraceae bacterium]|nr:GNAT family N-acetyltransferase [Steroidobacteraceae bacterium]